MIELTAFNDPGRRGLDGDGESESGEDKKAVESRHDWSCRQEY